MACEEAIGRRERDLQRRCEEAEARERQLNMGADQLRERQQHLDLMASARVRILRPANGKGLALLDNLGPLEDYNPDLGMGIRDMTPREMEEVMERRRNGRRKSRGRGRAFAYANFVDDIARTGDSPWPRRGSGKYQAHGARKERRGRGRETNYRRVG